MSRTSALGQFTNLPVLADAADITAVGTTMADRIEKYVNMRFTNAAARDAAITSPEAGMRAYLTATNVETVYDGTRWCGEWITINGGIGFQNSWVDFDAGHHAQYRKKDADTVELRGLIKSGTVGSSAFTLPTGFRPSLTDEEFVAAGSAVVGYVVVFATGLVTPTSPMTNTFCYLSGIRFSVSA